MRGREVFLAACAAFLIVGTAQAAPVLWNTGVDGSGVPLGHGLLDSHYRVGYGSNEVNAFNDLPLDNTYAVTDDGGWPIPPWLPDNTESAWISPQIHNPKPDDPHETDPDGYYAFFTTFELTAHEATYFHLAGQWSTDNPGVNIYVNPTDNGGSLTGGTGNTIDFGTSGNYSFQNWHAFDIGPGNWLTGTNTLLFMVQNEVRAEGNPTSLRVEMAPVPVPAALPLGLFGMGLVGLVARRRSRAKTA